MPAVLVLSKTILTGDEEGRQKLAKVASGYLINIYIYNMCVCVCVKIARVHDSYMIPCMLMGTWMMSFVHASNKGQEYVLVLYCTFITQSCLWAILPLDTIQI